MGKKIKLLTSDYILDESYTLLSISSDIKVIKSFSETINEAEIKKILEIVWVEKNIFYKALGMKLKFEDKPRVSFTDFTSMTIMLKYNIEYVITGDHRFQSVNLGLRSVLNKDDLIN